jgi:GNAT superfamily N-acetyltransferase
MGSMGSKGSMGSMGSMGSKGSEGIVLPLSIYYSSFPVNYSIVIAKLYHKIIGFIIVLPWFLDDKPVFIADYLFVFPKYRNQNIADKLITYASSPLLLKNGIGIFSTSYDLKTVKDANKITKLHWYKFKIFHYVNSYKKIINIDTLIELYKKQTYITNHVLFSSNLINDYLLRDYFLLFFSKNGFVYLSPCEKICIGFYILNDKAQKNVAQFAFIWNTLNQYISFVDLFNVMSLVSPTSHVIIPSFSPLYGLDVWDLSCHYFYFETNEKILFTRNQLLGWFLPR